MTINDEGIDKLVMAMTDFFSSGADAFRAYLALSMETVGENKETQTLRKEVTLMELRDRKMGLDRQRSRIKAEIYELGKQLSLLQSKTPAGIAAAKKAANTKPNKSNETEKAKLQPQPQPQPQTQVPNQEKPAPLAPPDLAVKRNKPLTHKGLKEGLALIQIAQPEAPTI